MNAIMSFQTSAKRCLFSALLLTSAAASPLLAQRLSAIRPELTATAASGEGQEVTFVADTLTRLLLLAPDETVEVADWPVAPGALAEVAIARQEIYAPGARLFRVEHQGAVEVPRSPLVFFTGRSLSGDTGVWLSIDPETRELSGGATVEGGRYELRAEGDVKSLRYKVAAAEAFLPKAGGSPSWGCSAAGLSELPGSTLFSDNRATPELATALASRHTATIAVDTDNELMQKRFGNDTASATDFLAQLFASMNVMYERDLNVRLLQGTTFLRPSTTPDPYTAEPDAGGGVSDKQLDELSLHWKNHYPTVSRALVMMLSGKLPGPNQSNGRAWIDGLCDTEYGYSFSHIFHNPAMPASANSKLVGHEIGHNFGSDHTHCYSPPIDRCTDFEGSRGCYTGPPSCPTSSTMGGLLNVRGSVMSYCNLLGSCSSSEVFHPRTIDLLNPILASKVGACIDPGTRQADAAPSRFYTLPPCRVIDTRGAAGDNGGPALTAYATRAFRVAGTCGIPADARAIVGNLTAITPEVAGFLNGYATGTPTSVSLVSFRPGQVKANNVSMKLPATGGSLTFQNGSGGSLHFVLDVTGYFK